MEMIAEIARLTATLERTEANHDVILSDLAEVTAERDQALAGIAAAFAMQDAGYRINTPADAQKALDRMLAKAREDAIREVLLRLRHEDDVNPSQTYDDAIEWVEYILALLTDGGRDE